MTKLNKPISRETNRVIGKRPIIVTVAPAGAQNEALIGFRLKGQRRQYVCAVSALYRVAALWHGEKEAKARKAARKAGIPWKQARKQFNAENSV
jgi:hypothetical protein